MATTVKTKKGRNVTLLNPSEKARKFADELSNKSKLTNDGHIKFAKNGGPVRLTQTESAYRSGYLDARKDSAKLFKWKQKKGF